MKKSLVSKYQNLIQPTYLIFAFCLGLISGALLNNNILYFVLGSGIVAAILLLLRMKFIILVLFVSLGTLVGSFHQFQVNKSPSEDCFTSEVNSTAKKFKFGLVYKVKTNPSLLIFTDEQLMVSDKVSFCKKNVLGLSKSEERYLLSQFKTKHVFEVRDLKVVSEGAGIRRSLNLLSLRVKQVSKKLFASDQGVLAYGIIFGSSSDFSKEFKSELKASGTTHIVAVSGYNVSIITSWLFDTLRNIGKNFSGIVSVLLLIIFFLMTGGSASVLRASVMGIIVLISKFIGRVISPLHLLILAGTLILVFNPYAIFDWGFQLSFMATAGLFFLSAIIAQKLSFLKINQTLIKVLSETISAQIFVLPILVSSFGSFSVISPLSNLLILPFIPLIMILVFGSLLTYPLVPAVGILFSEISKILLTYVMTVIHYSSQVPHAAVNLKLPSSLGIILGYLIIFAFTYLLRKYDKTKSI